MPSIRDTALDLLSELIDYLDNDDTPSGRDIVSRAIDLHELLDTSGTRWDEET